MGSILVTTFHIDGRRAAVVSVDAGVPFRIEVAGAVVEVREPAPVVQMAPVPVRAAKARKRR